MQLKKERALKDDVKSTSQIIVRNMVYYVITMLSIVSSVEWRLKWMFKSHA